MGYYIDPVDCTKEQWLKQHGVRLDAAPDWSAVRKDDRLPVCLVDNGLFTAAGVAYSPNEQAAFARPDGRAKAWFSVAIADLRAVKAIPDWFAA